MIQQNWFVTPVWHSYFQEDFSIAANKCLDLRDSGYSNRKISNVGGWQSEDINLIDFDEFKSLYDIILTCIEEVGVSIHQKFKCRLDNVWININERGNYNNPHVHPSATLSGVIYLQADDNCGRLVFKNETSVKKHYPYHFYNESSVFSDYVYYTPVTGMSLIFPAWTDHYVEESNSDLPRISVAYNIRQI